MKQMKLKDILSQITETQVFAKVRLKNYKS